MNTMAKYGTQKAISIISENWTQAYGRQFECYKSTVHIHNIGMKQYSAEPNAKQCGNAVTQYY